MVEFKKEINAVFAELALPDPKPLRELLDHCLDPLDALLELGAEQLKRSN